MVSTRGMKFKFSEGERVLCYEPDPTKAKVLYDSKVLEVHVSKEKSRKIIEYLIHFQGWNSSWDRLVSEDFVLRDTDENRQLQRDLAEKAQLQLGAYLYRRERKKSTSNRSKSETLEQRKVRRRRRGGGGAVSEEESPGRTTSPSQSGNQDTDPEEEDEANITNIECELQEDEVIDCQQSSSEGEGEESSGEEDEPPLLEFSEKFKSLLDQDYNLINNNNKVRCRSKCETDSALQPNAATILEGYLHYCAITQLCGHMGKQERGRYRNPPPNKAANVYEACKGLNLIRELVNGLRIYFDFTLGDQLLYRHEQEQYKQLRSSPPLRPVIKQEISDSARESDDGHPLPVKEEKEDPHPQPGDLDGKPPGTASPKKGRKRILRSNRPDTETTMTNGLGQFGRDADQQPFTVKTEEVINHHFSNSNSQSSSLPSIPERPTSPRSHTLLNRVLVWRCIPDKLYSESPVVPCLVYGAAHLARLLVKLPEMLYSTNMTERRLKLVLRDMYHFMKYLEEHDEWFGEQFYKDNPNSLV
uniref:Protein male-specific lethal-3 n=1 Tax=Timema bartmani TaxID=61472 RepID=A0A7R9F6F9_9NEOP|nr:unnamed protein product [Timema bartmani]